MSKLLTVLHVFYHDQIDYFIDKLSNINGIEWDLVVTYSTRSVETEAKIKGLKPDARLLQVPNVGYDVWPFIQVMRCTDCSEYDYVLKLHTKGESELRFNGVNFKGSLWRDLLVDAIMKSKRHFSACIDILEKQSDVGMICSYELFKKMEDILPEDTHMLQEEARRISLDITDAYFCAGTMFLARSDCFMKLQEFEYAHELWGNLNKSHASGTLAHVYERILCLMVFDRGYKIVKKCGSKFLRFSVFYKSNLSPFIKQILNLYRDPYTREKYLTLFGIKINLSDRTHARN